MLFRSQGSAVAGSVQYDASVQELYGGQWVVAVNGIIVAHGEDVELVLRDAAHITGKNPAELVACAIPSPDSWLANA